MMDLAQGQWHGGGGGENIPRVRRHIAGTGKASCKSGAYRPLIGGDGRRHRSCRAPCRASPPRRRAGPPARPGGVLLRPRVPVQLPGRRARRARVRRRDLDPRRRRPAGPAGPGARRHEHRRRVPPGRGAGRCAAAAARLAGAVPHGGRRPCASPPTPPSAAAAASSCWPRPGSRSAVASTSTIPTRSPRRRPPPGLSLEDGLGAACDQSRDAASEASGRVLLAAGADRLPALRVGRTLHWGERRVGNAVTAARYERVARG